MRKVLLALGIVAALTVGAGTALAAAQAGAANGRSSMHDQMMSGTQMGSMMGSVDMDAMHDAMGNVDMDTLHAQMRDLVPADVRAACDEAHAQMNADTSTGTSMPMDHAAHHGANR